MNRKKIPIVVGSTSRDTSLWFGSVILADERQRLERDVINAAAFWRQDWLMNSQQLRDAVDALDAFESEVKVRRAELDGQAAGILTRGY